MKEIKDKIFFCDLMIEKLGNDSRVKDKHLWDVNEIYQNNIKIEKILREKLKLQKII